MAQKHSDNAMFKGVSRIAVLIFASGFAAAAATVASCTDSPYLIWHTLSTGASMPPLWFAALLWFGGYFLIGAAAGGAFSMQSRGAQCDVLRYRGGMFCVLSVTFGFMWYILIFGKQAVFASIIPLALSLVFAVLCCSSWIRLGKITGVCSVLYSFWLFALFLFNLAMLVSV